MPIEAVDHINIRTANVEGMSQWYTDILEMPSGARPNFGFGGAWLYLGDTALIHLVEVDHLPEDTDPKLEHFALRASGLADFLDRLQSHNVAYRIAEVPSLPIVQVNIHDPDGNHIHVDFSAEEYQALNGSIPA